MNILVCVLGLVCSLQLGFSIPLSEYPRPPKDTGRGLHWSPDQYAWGQQNYGEDWLMWAERLLDMHVNWLKVIIPPDYTADSLVKRLIDLKIMPVSRYITKNPTVATGGVLATCQRLIQLGAPYFETNNEPDANNEWDTNKPDNWEWVVVDNLITDSINIGFVFFCFFFLSVHVFAYLENGCYPRFFWLCCACVVVLLFTTDTTQATQMVPPLRKIPTQFRKMLKTASAYKT